MTEKTSKPVIAIHGGAGAISKSALTPEASRSIRAGLRQALEAGWTILHQGGTALDAVTAAVIALENDPHFNAGHGAAFNRAGQHELDASIMDGYTGLAGAVAGVKRIKHPVLAARELARVADPILLIGDAADSWASGQNLELVENTFFSTAARRELLEKMLERERLGTAGQATEQEKHGTVGAAALDLNGHLAAATSTGGYTAKPVGRVGDSPLIGAGTWADDRTCAVSGTGKGELFIRTALAHSIHARMLFAGQTLQEAAQAQVDEVGRLGNGGAGLCAVDAQGNVTLPFNTEGMYRGWMNAENLFVAIHQE